MSCPLKTQKEPKTTAGVIFISYKGNRYTGKISAIEKCQIDTSVNTDNGRSFPNIINIWKTFGNFKWSN